MKTKNPLSRYKMLKLRKILFAGICKAKLKFPDILLNPESIDNIIDSVLGEFPYEDK